MDSLIINYLSPYLIDDCIDIILEYKKEMEYFEDLHLIFRSILSNKNKKKKELTEEINIRDMIFYLHYYEKDIIKKYYFHLYIYDNYSFCKNIRLNYQELFNFKYNGLLNINSIQRINNKRFLLVLDEDYSKLDNISKITKGFKYYIKRCTNFVYIKMNIAYIKLCFIRNPTITSNT
jgi:hypothetical protein